MNGLLGFGTGFVAGLLVLWIAGRPRFSRRSHAKTQPSPASRRVSPVDFGAVALTAALSGIVGWRVEAVSTLLLGCVVIAFFMLLALLDLRYRLVPNILLYPAAGAALAGHLIFGSVHTALLALASAAGGFALFALAGIVSPGGLGGGDIKLAGFVGLLLGFPSSVWALTLAILTGGMVAIVMVIAGKRAPMPYAPFLCFGALILWIPWIS